uniref:dehydrogenase/reductase SDR family member 11-like n=1 Tax=Styela clava TaxID=7725 RepID=UPI00193A5A16|nr:dehydrogenase/reductase SDR family member 11-like [Styela clava]
MERWAGKIALVTGASSGIGKATVGHLVKHNMKVVACARNHAKLKEFCNIWNKNEQGEVFAVKCDVTSESEVLNMFREIKRKYGVLHVCVNSAGLCHPAPLLSGTLTEWNSMISTNILGLCLCTREAVKLMESGGVDDGHVIHINSMSGHRVKANNPHGYLYTATKHAVTALGKGLRHELIMRGSRIRVTCISPGTVETEFFHRMYHRTPEKANEIQSSLEGLTADDIADAVVYALGTPPRVNVCDIHVKPLEQKT